MLRNEVFPPYARECGRILNFEGLIVSHQFTTLLLFYFIFKQIPTSFINRSGKMEQK